MKRLIDEQYERAKSILKKNRKGLQQLAEILLEKEVIFSDDLGKIFGKRPWKSDEELPKLPEKVNAKKKAIKEPDAPPEEQKIDREGPAE